MKISRFATYAMGVIAATVLISGCSSNAGLQSSSQASTGFNPAGFASARSRPGCGTAAMPSPMSRRIPTITSLGCRRISQRRRRSSSSLTTAAATCT